MFSLLLMNRRKSFPFHASQAHKVLLRNVEFAAVQKNCKSRRRRSDESRSSKRTAKSSEEKRTLRGLKKVSTLKSLQLKNLKVENLYRHEGRNKQVHDLHRDERVQDE